MRTRTHLTTPPGQQPELSADTRPGDETYVPGFALPDEPRVPGRYRRVWITAAVVVVLAAAGFGMFRSMTAGQSFDPALDAEFAPVDDGATGTATSSPTDGLPGE